MKLFFISLEREIKKLHANNIRIQFLGDRSALSASLQKKMAESELLTKANDGMDLNIAVNYGGRLEVQSVCQQVATKVQAGELVPDEITVDLLDEYFFPSNLARPDLFIRTSGEQRISNFFLWQLAYTELFFTDCLWPDFDAEQLQLAIDEFGRRQRRFGKTAEQLMQTKDDDNA